MALGELGLAVEQGAGTQAPMGDLPQKRLCDAVGFTVSPNRHVELFLYVRLILSQPIYLDAPNR